MPPAETFFGLSPTQVAGWAALSSLILTAVLVVTTIRYVRLTREIATAARESHQHVVEMAQEEREARRAVLGAAVTSMRHGLQEMLTGDFLERARSNVLPIKVPALHPPAEILLAYVSGASIPTLPASLTLLLQNIAAGEAHVETLSRLPRPHQSVATLAERAEAYFEAALTEAQACIGLLKGGEQ